jgi:hypothetical protein
LVKPDVARRQMEAEAQPTPSDSQRGTGTSAPGAEAAGFGKTRGQHEPVTAPLPRRFHGTVRLNPNRVGLDASRIADEVLAHLVGQVGAEVTVTLEIEATLPNGASGQIVRTVTENSRTLKFTSQGFENE